MVVRSFAQAMASFYWAHLTLSFSGRWAVPLIPAQSNVITNVTGVSGLGGCTVASSLVWSLQQTGVE